MDKDVEQLRNNEAGDRSASNALTLLNPLRKKESISLSDFYDYWLNAHVTLPPRFPGISSVWLHAVSFDAARWPQIPGVSTRPAPDDEIHGVPEVTFRTFDDLAAFQRASGVQMNDGINFLSEQLTYASLGDHTVTLVDRTDLPAPDGTDRLLRHLVWLRHRESIPVEGFHAFVAEKLAPGWASSPDVLKVRMHLFEPLAVTLDHPGVTMYKPAEQQYQACIEVVTADNLALDRFAASAVFAAADVTHYCEAVHAVRAQRVITTKVDGDITLAGVRGVAVADIIRSLDAKSQLDAQVSALFLPASC